MKRQNYYQVHKNKRPRLKKKKFNWYPILKRVFQTMQFVNDLVRASQPMPKYSLGGVFSGNKQPEIIMAKNGDFKELGIRESNQLHKSCLDVSLKANEVTESFKKVVESMNKCQMPIINNHE